MEKCEKKTKNAGNEKSSQVDSSPTYFILQQLKKKENT